MLSRRTFMAGAVVTVAAPVHAQDVPSPNLDELVLQPFALEPLPGITEIPVPSLETLQGRVTALNFWASWCEGCQDEHRFLLDLRDKGVPIAGIDIFDQADAAVHYLEKSGNPFAFLGVDGKRALAAMLGVSSLPRTFLIGPNAQVAWHTDEGLDEDLVAALLVQFEALRG